MKTTMVFLAFLAGGFPAFAQHLPDKPTPAMPIRQFHHHGKLEITEHVALAATSLTFAGLDASATRDYNARGGSEANPLYRPIAGSNVLYPVMASVSLSAGYLGWKMRHSNHAALRASWWVPQTFVLVGNIRGWRQTSRVLAEKNCWIRVGSLSCFR